MDPRPIVVTVNVDGKHDSEMSVLATKLLIAAFGVIDGQPASAAKLDVEWEGEDYSLGAIMVRDEETFCRFIHELDAIYGKSQQKKTGMVMVSELLKELGIDVDELRRRLDEPPCDPRMN